MSEKLATGIGIPFGDAASPSEAPSLADGYYYQPDLADPRTSSGWISGPDLHNTPSGDTSTFYQTAAGGSSRPFSFLVAKSTGMMVDTVILSPGYTATLTLPVFYGSNDLSNWTQISVSSIPLTPTHLSMAYITGCSYGLSAAAAYAYLGCTFSDTGSTAAQVGCADVRLKHSGTEVGP